MTPSAHGVDTLPPAGMLSTPSTTPNATVDCPADSDNPVEAQA